MLTEHVARTEDRKPIPSLQFSTESFEPREQFEVWRDLMAPMADVELPAAAGIGFRARAQAYDLGAFHLFSFDTDPAAFIRTDEHVRKSGIDHWCLSIVNKGDLEIVPGSRQSATTGDMLLQTYTAPFSGVVGGEGLSCLFLNRDDFCGDADALDAIAGQNMAGPMSPILRGFIVSLENQANRLSAAEIPAVNEAFAHLLKATVRPNADTLEAARMPIAATQFAVARRIIDGHLKSPDLTPDMICARMGVSRRQLYYIFQPHGGVMKFITQRRLAACHNALVARAGKKLVSSVAYAYGFTHLSSFYRQFQARYGFRPGEARSAWLDGHALRKATDGTFADWLARADPA